MHSIIELVIPHQVSIVSSPSCQCVTSSHENCEGEEDIQKMKMCCAVAAVEVLMAASSIYKTKRQEAKAAADAAAAAAADACAVCEKMYGDDADKDKSWIACDRCNRWFHGSCVGLSQVSTAIATVALRPEEGTLGRIRGSFWTL